MIGNLFKKSILLVLLNLFILSPDMLFSQEKTVRYEGSVSAGIILGSCDNEFILNTSHGVRFVKPEWKFLYLGCSLEGQFGNTHTVGGSDEHSPILLQLHAKANIPATTRLQAFVGCEAGAMWDGLGTKANLSPSIGTELRTCRKQAVVLTLKTYINKTTVGAYNYGMQYMLTIGYKF